MIHYTLLPEEEMKTLKREYRIRLFIFSLFFISCAVVLGIFSLIPAYILSFSQEKQVLDKLELLQQNRKENGTEAVVKDLRKSGEMMQKINTYGEPIVFSKMISEIISHKTSGLTIASFQFTNPKNIASSSEEVVVIQGKAGTRESLLSFKSKLESNPLISKIELPVSDLAKSKDISFSLKLSIDIKKLTASKP